MAAAAETLIDRPPELDYITQFDDIVATSLRDAVGEAERTSRAVQAELPFVWDVASLELESEARGRAARFIGSVALGDIARVEIPNHEKPIGSLYEAITRAKQGDAVAKAHIRSNMGTDMVERTLKAGHVGKPVRLKRAPGGGFVQHGQHQRSVQANSLLYAADHPIMRARNEAETRNMFRTEMLDQYGFFEDGYCLVVFSLAENLPGFYKETMSCSIQVTSKEEGSDDLLIEPAFVAGIAESGAARHDLQTIVSVGGQLGVDWSGLTPAGIIDHSVLIHKSMIPNGAIDVVRLWDKVNGTFFGENKPSEDYVEYLQKCREREATFDEKIDQATEELIAEAEINSPVQAIERLHDISEKHMVEKAVEDATIDPRVFGPEAAPYIVQARAAAADGNIQAYQLNLQEAKKTAYSDSCPGSRIKSPGDTEESSDGKSDSDSSTSEDCEFISKECPICHKKNVKTKSTKTHISGDCGCRVKK